MTAEEREGRRRARDMAFREPIVISLPSLLVCGFVFVFVFGGGGVVWPFAFAKAGFGIGDEEVAAFVDEGGGVDAGGRAGSFCEGWT